VPELSASKTVLAKLLDSEKEFRAPIFQRPYVWGQKQLNRVWSDIDAVETREEGTRFLGAIVLLDRSRPSASSGAREYLIVDGQQRLTTLYLLLVAVAEHRYAVGDVEGSLNLLKRHLINQFEEYSGRPKIRPTNRDLAQFNAVLQRLKGLPVVAPEAFGDTGGDLLNAYLKLFADLGGRLKDLQVGPTEDLTEAKVDYLATIQRTVLDDLRIVEILLGDDDDPQQVFESLNTTGEPLDVIDLVRTDVFYKLADQPAEAQALYNGPWHFFEEALGADLNDYFFPYALIRKPTTTKAQVFTKLKEDWTGKSPTDILAELQQYVPAYLSLRKRDGLELSAGLLRAIERLRRMRTPTSVYPFAMRVIQEALAGTLSASDAEANLMLLESFLVRRAIAGFEPTGLHAVFKNMWAGVKDDGTAGDPAQFVPYIEKRATVQFPTDDELREYVRERPLYTRRLANYIIVEYELTLEGGDTVPLGGDAHPNIDHVMPQDFSEEWSELVDEKMHDRYVHTWANLVPLSRPLNSEKGNKTWPEIREYLKAETIYKTTKRLAAQYPEWNLDAILDRAGVLGEWAVIRWPKG
jgi:hypothetical protein